MSAALSSEAACAVEAAKVRERPSLHLLPIARARQRYEDDHPCSGTPSVYRVEELAISREVPARLYRPRIGRLPVVVFFHGGGWVVGSLDTHDRVCREIAVRSGCAVLSVGYRLAPEHPYPTAVDDAHAALIWVRDRAGEYELDRSRLAVAGDSAGGNIAAALAIRSRSTGVPIALQVLLYPVTSTDLDRWVDPAYDGLVLSRAELAWHQEQYLPQVRDRSSACAAPLHCHDLSLLPPALFVVAECDPLAPQSYAYAAALRDAGVPAEIHLHHGALHGFVQQPEAFAAADRALDRAAAVIWGRLGGASPGGRHDRPDLPASPRTPTIEGGRT